jgi:hypothetical protein
MAIIRTANQLTKNKMAIKRYTLLSLMIAILMSGLIHESSAQCTGQNITYGTFDGAGYSTYNNATLNQAAPPLADIPNNGICWDDASATTLDGSPAACAGGGFTIANSDDYYEDWDVANSFGTHSGNMMIVNIDGTAADYPVLSNSYTGCLLTNTYTLSVDYAMLNHWPVGAGTRSVSLQYSSNGTTWTTCGSNDMSNKCNVCGAGSTNTNPGWSTFSCVIPSTSTIYARVMIHKGFSGGDDNKHDWAFDNFSLIGSSSAPVEFVSFSGKSSGDGTFLTWVTAYEINSSHFDVERSNDGINWQVVGTVHSKNSSTGYSYNYYDPETSGKQPVYYRIREVDTDNTQMYSATISPNGSQNDSFMEIIPNLTDQGSIVQIASSNDMLSASVYDLLGNTLLATNVDSPMQNLNCNNLATGVYIIKGLFEGGNTLTKKLVIR